MKRPLLLALGILLLIVGVLTPIVATFVTFILPETYSATTRLLLPGRDPDALANEMERIRSEPLLHSVITNQHLAEAWGKQFKSPKPLPLAAAYGILLQSIDVHATGSDIIDITAYSDDRDQAAILANAIGQAYLSSARAREDRKGETSAQLISSAVPPVRPVRPNKALNIALGLIAGGVPLTIGALLLAIATRNRAPNAQASSPPPLVRAR